MSVHFLGAGLLAAAASDRLENSIRLARADGGFVLLALVDEASRRSVEEALSEPTCRRKLPVDRQVVASAGENPVLCSRFGSRTLPLLILLDARGQEVGRSEGAASATAAVQALRSLVEVAEKVTWCKARLKRDPDDRDALYWLGVYHWNRNEQHQGAEYFRRVLELTADSAAKYAELRARSREKLGGLYLKCGLLAEAEALFRQVDLREAGEHGDWVALHLALVLRRQGRAGEAVKVLETRLKHSASSSDAPRLIFTIAYLRQEAGQKQAAFRIFDDLRLRFPHTTYGRRAARYLESLRVRDRATTTPDDSSAALAR